MFPAVSGQISELVSPDAVRMWCSGLHGRLPSDRPGFEPRHAQIAFYSCYFASFSVTHFWLEYMSL